MDDAYSYAVKVCKDRQRPNGTLTLNVLGKNFNDFGHYTEQFAATAIVSELLIQSVNNIIRVFPAWDKTKNAQFQSLRAKGGFLVSSSLTNGECDFVEIKSTVGGNLKVLCPREEMELTLNGKKINIQKNKSGIVEIATEAKDIILLKNQS
jgi:hypothetical protein